MLARSRKSSITGACRVSWPRRVFTLGGFSDRTERASSSSSSSGKPLSISSIPVTKGARGLNRDWFRVRQRQSKEKGREQEGNKETVRGDKGRYQEAPLFADGRHETASRRGGGLVGGVCLRGLHGREDGHVLGCRLHADARHIPGL